MMSWHRLAKNQKVLNSQRYKTEESSKWQNDESTIRPVAGSQIQTEAKQEGVSKLTIPIAVPWGRTQRAVIELDLMLQLQEGILSQHSQLLGATGEKVSGSLTAGLQ